MDNFTPLFSLPNKDVDNLYNLLSATLPYRVLITASLDQAEMQMQFCCFSQNILTSEEINANFLFESIHDDIFYVDGFNFD